LIGELSRKDAAEKFAELSKRDFENLSFPKGSDEFRKDIIECSDSIKNTIAESSGSMYEYDLRLGLYFYKKINEVYSFSERDASQDGKWRYISLVLLPDVVYSRWTANETRFFSHPTRIYFKSLWWYIHLSWQGSEEKTFEILKNNTTDDVVQLVERIGSLGYRIDLYREIMNYYGNLEVSRKGRSASIFRKVMKLNTTRGKMIEPALHNGGTRGYVKELFDYFD
jgi:hypothetical protein